MKRMAFAVPIVMAGLIAAAPLAHADDDGGAAALGFMLGTMAAAPAYAYGSPPAYVYQAPPRVVVRVPNGGYYYAPPPRVYYHRFRDHDRWHHRWHHDRYHHRHWRHGDDD
jgi:hypothetical protein